MLRQFAKLQNIDCNDEVAKESQYEFLYQLEGALLLALRERGSLNAMQYRYAAEKLRLQRLGLAKRSLGEGKGYD